MYRWSGTSIGNDFNFEKVNLATGITFNIAFFVDGWPPGGIADDFIGDLQFIGDNQFIATTEEGFGLLITLTSAITSTVEVLNFPISLADKRRALVPLLPQLIGDLGDPRNTNCNLCPVIQTSEPTSAPSMAPSRAMATMAPSMAVETTAPTSVTGCECCQSCITKKTTKKTTKASSKSTTKTAAGITKTFEITSTGSSRRLRGNLT